MVDCPFYGGDTSLCNKIASPKTVGNLPHSFTKVSDPADPDRIHMVLRHMDLMKVQHQRFSEAGPFQAFRCSTRQASRDKQQHHSLGLLCLMPAFDVAFLRGRCAPHTPAPLPPPFPWFSVSLPADSHSLLH